MELPWINSFYRMMIHRVANCFQLERRIDTTQKTITLYRTDQSALPAFRFVDIHHEEAEEEEGEEEEETPVLTPTATTVKPIKVLKRCPPRPASVCGGRSSSSSRADDSNQRTVSIKEREEAYAKARARIFQGTEVSHSPSLSSSSSSSPRPQLSRSKTVAEPANETNTDETSTVVGSDNGTVMASPMSPGSSTTYHHDGSFSVHQRGRSSDTSESFAGYSPTQPYSGHFYGDPSRRTSAPSLGAHVTHRQVVPGARHFVQGSDGVIRYDPTIDISPQQPPPRPHQGSTKGTYSLQGQDQYTHPSHEVYLHHPPHIQHPQLPQHHHYPGHHHDQACPIVRQHSAPETYMTKDQLMCPFVQQHLQQHHNHHHHNHHHHIPHPTHLHHAPPPPQQHLYPPHHRPPPRQATYPVYGIISAPPPQTQHQGSPRQGHHGVGAYPMDLYPCSCMHHEGYSPDMGSIAPGFGHHPTPPPPHSHPQPVSPMRPSGGSQQSARARMPSTRGGSDGGGIQLPSYPVYDVDKRPPKSTELYDPKNPKCTTRKRG
ncbi:hypothetical protein MVEG_03837 [Podila verticillata NRRL 6337]|nr:hypothetical protein MVEG_03837 [Podila verticillata NRRL 6337]